MDTVMYLLMLYLCLLPLTSGQPARNAQQTLETDNHSPRLVHTEDTELYAAEGTKYTIFDCDIHGSKNATSITWFRNGSAITPSGDPDSRRFVTGKTGFMLILRNLTLSDHKSVIGCRLTNSHGTTWQNVTLIVIPEAELTQYQSKRGPFPDGDASHQSVETLVEIRKSAGENGVLLCPLEGFPNLLSVFWTKDGDALGILKMAERIYMSGRDSSLRISALQVSDSGHYQCTATNFHGTAVFSYDVVVVVSHQSGT
ncbi:contactin-6-like [Paramacrobiotus metropolitanus]|uniref:contactin-6-like n=1 Tax=Paramacrobiotus metropolitanus TaxID=2943436 RepID=UPI002445EA0E|nr:contactin-6-like [Paramacrobiotus metropolitanus]